MTDYKTISFTKESKVKIGNVTYVVNSCFDEMGESLKEKIKHLLITEIQNFFDKQAPNN